MSDTKQGDPHMNRSWTQVPTWLYAWHVFVFFWSGGCVGFLIGWLAR